MKAILVKIKKVPFIEWMISEGDGLLKINTIVVIVLGITLLALLTFTGCTRRTLEDDIFETALIPVRIDWSASGVKIEEMHRASIWLFPIDGGKPIEYRLEGNLRERDIAVPVGIYSVLVFNETIDDDDWKTITFTGTDSYEKFAVMAIPEESKGFYFRSDNFPLVANPETIAAWNLDRFEVTPEMLNITRAENEISNDDDILALTVIKPTPMYERVIMKVFVKNLASSMQATGTIDGMVSGIYLSSGEIINEEAVHAFVLGDRIYDDNGNDGITTRTFNIFGRDGKNQNNVSIDFLLTDGTLFPLQKYEVSKLIYTDTEQVVVTHYISLGYSNTNGDHEIELPDSDMQAGVSVEDWEEVIIPIK
ncbi:MAG: DUF5119 domain-containing protein [Marinilabiliaceae bacterium]|nr:DUF5119 domain-containing protein [Marinilabiliaceae bacterium]